MALSEQEQRALRDLERSLLADDPHFGSSLSDYEDASVSGQVTLRGIAIVVIGLLMLVGGVAASQHSLWFIALSIAGFLVMLAGGLWMVRGGAASRAGSQSTGKKTRQKTRPEAAKKSGSLGDRMEDNFRKRFE